MHQGLVRLTRLAPAHHQGLLPLDLHQRASAWNDTYVIRTWFAPRRDGLLANSAIIRRQMINFSGLPEVSDVARIGHFPRPLGAGQVLID